MSRRRIRPNPSKISRLGSARHSKWQALIAAALLSGGVLTPGILTWANTAASPGPILNQATGSFVDPTDGSTQLIESNIVQVTVAEVAGITVVSSGYTEPTDGAVNNGDTVYFDFVITNVGNDPSQFFIPDAPSAISGGVAGTLQIIAYDADGTGAGAEEDLSGSNITVPNGGDATGNLLSGVANTNNGSVPAGGSITVRVPVTVTGVAGTDVSVTLGNTAAAPNNQNQPYTTPPSDTENVYTVDNSGTTNGDTTGDPLNGEREASDSVTEAIASSTPTPTVTCPTGSSATGGGYASSGSGQYRDDIFWLDWNCGPTSQFNPGDVVQKTWTGPNGIEITATVSNITQTLHPYNTGNWVGDRLDELYGGVNPIGLRNLNASEDPTYDVTFSMTLNGVPISADIVTAEAEDTGWSNEYATWTTDGTPWQPLEAAPSSSLDVTFSNGGQTIYMDDDPDGGGGVLIALSEDVSTISVDMNAGGNEAIAFGIMVPFDYGDADGYTPSGGHFARRTATGGSQPTTATAVNSLMMATLVNDTPYLGTVGPDIENAENSDQPTVGADGDDNSGIDDEDGITLTTLTEGDTSYTIPAGNITANTTGAATLHAWVDFNQNSTFEASEYQSVVVNNGTPAGDLTWSGLSGITSGTTYARFRLTTDTNINGSTPNDVAIDGEMEDYALAIAASTPSPPANSCELLLTNSGFDLPDITSSPPSPVAVFNVPGGTVNNYNQGDIPGWSTTAPDGLIEIWSSGADGISAFEGAQFAEINANGVGALFQDVSTTPNTLLTWQFAHRGRNGTDTLRLNLGAPGATVTQTTVSTGNSAWTLYQGTYLVPAGQTVTRFEFEAGSTGGVGSSSQGNFLDAIRFGPLCDHGDADASYPVVRANSGAAHTYDGITFLGGAAAVELDGQPSTAADGDDNASGDGDGQDDEDGVTFTSTLTAGANATVDVVASVAGPLSAWIDFNSDGDWDDAGEQIFSDESLSAGTNSLSFAIPAAATVGNTYARFRISPQSGLTPTGIVGGGEVEDYQVAIAAAVTATPGVINYPNSGNGRYPGSIALLDWTGSAFEDGIQDGDIIEFPLPMCRTGTLRATVSNVVNPANADLYEPVDMQTWSGASMYQAYNGPGAGEALYITNGALGARHITFTVTWSMVVNGQTVLPDIFVFDAESTNQSQGEFLTATTNGGNWSLIDNAGGSNYTISGLGTQTVSITKSEFPSNSAVFLSMDTTETTVDINAGGRQAVAFGILLPCDYGDAPASYGDSAHAYEEEPALPIDNPLNPGGLQWIAASGQLHLGSAPPDSETNSQSSANPNGGDGDDNDSLGDDEDGVTLPQPTAGDTSYTIPVANISAVNNTGGDATLHAWVDFDKSGTFDPDEYDSATVNASGAATSDLTWSGITVGAEGETYARFRLTTDPAINSNTPDGQAFNGEVEDYQVAIASTPTTPTAPANACELLLINDSFEDPRVTIQPPVPDRAFGSAVFIYNESDVPGWLSSADNFIEIWDENNSPAATGIPTVPPFENNQFAEINADLNGSLFQDAATTPSTVLTWQFAHRGRTGVDTLELRLGPPGATVAQINPTTGTTSFTTGTSDWVVYQGTYTVPPGQTITRFEYVAVSTASGDPSTGNFLDAVRFGPLCDHGDADASYPVVRANGGAAHTFDGVTYLGNNVLVELDAQPSTNADGDDNAAGDTDGGDDEDGVTFTSALEAGSTATVDIVASVAAPLSAWIDFNNDGDWDDADEQIFTDEPLAAGNNSLSFTIPAAATVGNTYARFRISPQSGLTPTGIVGGGEVEDYQLTIAQASDPNVLLVKRITLLNGDFSTTNGDDLAAYIDEATNDYDDNTLTPNLDPADTDQWPDPATFLIGGIDGGDVRPNDEIEYTIYFLSSGDAAANNVLFCDRVPDFVDFLPNIFNVNPTADVNGNPNGDRGIVVGLGTGVAAAIDQFALTNEADGDIGYYFPPGVEPTTTFPNINCDGTNDNGAVVVNLGDLPNATSAGEPAGSYGFVRFRARVR